MKLQASCSPFESLPASVWQRVRGAIYEICNEWAIPITVEDDLTVRDAEARFEEWRRRPKDGE